MVSKEKKREQRRNKGKKSKGDGLLTMEEPALLPPQTPLQDTAATTSTPTTTTTTQQPQREFSDNLQQLKFMSRKKPVKENGASGSSANVLVESAAKAKRSNAQWELPETTTEHASIFNPHINVSMPIILRKALTFATDSDAVHELALFSSLAQKNKHHSGKRARNEDDEYNERGGRFSMKKRSFNAEGEEEDQDDVSSVDDEQVVQHYAKRLKKQQQRRV